jgi:hypothetical protein
LDLQQGGGSNLSANIASRGGRNGGSGGKPATREGAETAVVEVADVVASTGVRGRAMAPTLSALHVSYMWQGRSHRHPVLQAF